MHDMCTIYARYLHDIYTIYARYMYDMSATTCTLHANFIRGERKLVGGRNSIYFFCLFFDLSKKVQGGRGRVRQRGCLVRVLAGETQSTVKGPRFLGLGPSTRRDPRCSPTE